MTRNGGPSVDGKQNAHLGGISQPWTLAEQPLAIGLKGTAASEEGAAPAKDGKRRCSTSVENAAARWRKERLLAKEPPRFSGGEGDLEALSVRGKRNKSRASMSAKKGAEMRWRPRLSPGLRGAKMGGERGARWHPKCGDRKRRLASSELRKIPPTIGKTWTLRKKTPLPRSRKGVSHYGLQEKKGVVCPGSPELSAACDAQGKKRLALSADMDRGSIHTSREEDSVELHEEGTNMRARLYVGGRVVTCPCGWSRIAGYRTKVREGEDRRGPAQRAEGELKGSGLMLEKHAPAYLRAGEKSNFGSAGRTSARTPKKQGCAGKRGWT